MRSIPIIPDYELLRRIGGGAYGEVWLARSTATGILRAGKIVWRDTFEDERPFRREFEGIQRFERISREHPSQLALFHIGRNDAEGYFYYVMELADGVGREWSDGVSEWRSNGEGKSQQLASAELTDRLKAELQTYSPHTLRAELERGRLPVERVLEIGLALTEALGHLHGHGLVHRDVKPSNVIFVNGRPKLADIGLVTDASDARSIVGTEGYIAPEGPGTPQADIYALGKVLYEMSMGRDRRHFPDLPEDWQSLPDRKILLELNEVLLRACAQDTRKRYQNAEEMRGELEFLRCGKSVKSKRAFGRRLSLAIRTLSVTAVIGFLMVAGYSLRPRRNLVGIPAQSLIQKKAENPEVARLCKLARFYYYKFTDDGNTNAMECLNQALEIDPNSIETYVTLADLCVVAENSELLPYKQAEVKMRWARDKLLVIDSSRAEGHAVEGFLNLVYDWNPSQAQKELALAVDRDPDLLVGRIWQGRYFLYTGRFKEAEREFKKAQQLDPTRYALNVFVALPSFFARDYDRAIELFQNAIGVKESYGWGAVLAGKAYEEKGDFIRAIDAFRKADITNGVKPEESEQKLKQLRDAFDKSGPQGYWRKNLEFELELQYDLDIPRIYSHLGDRDKAFEWIEKKMQVRSEFLLWLNVDPCWDNIRSDPRFVALLRRMGFAPKRSENPEVARLCKLGYFHYCKITEDGIAKAMECFNKALDIDPNSVEAYTRIADLCVGGQGLDSLPLKTAETKMRWAKEKLAAIDSDLPVVHAAQGYIQMTFDWNPSAAEKELKLALQIDPELMLGHVWYGRYLLFIGRFDESEHEFRRALQLDPTRYGLSVYQGLPAFFKRDYNIAIQQFQKAIEVVPTLNWAFWMIGLANEENGDCRSAIDAFQKCDLASGDKPETVARRYEELSKAYENSGQEGYWRKRLEFTQKQFEHSASQNAALDFAAVCAHLNERDLAFKALDRAFQEKSDYLLWLNLDPTWDNIRSDTRFVALLRRMGFAPKRTENPEVVRLCKLGHFHYSKLTDDGMAKAMECFNKALEIDPSSVEAYTRIAQVCVAAQGSEILPYKAAETKMRWAKDRLAAIDSTLPIVHAAQGYIQMTFDWNQHEAERELKLALEIDPQLVFGHVWYGRYLLFTGNFEQAEEEFKTALQLDPTRYGPTIFVGLSYVFRRDYEKAIQHFEKAIEFMPNLELAFWEIGDAYERNADYVAAIAIYRKAGIVAGEKPEAVKQRYDELAEAYQKSDGEGYWRKSAELEKKRVESSHSQNAALSLAASYAHLNEKDAAFKVLESAFEDKSEYLLWLNVDPRWDNIRSDPGFVALLEKMGFRK